MFNDQGALLYEFGFQGTGPNGLKTPRGTRLRPDGRLFVLESNGGRVNIFNVGATSASRWPVPGSVGDSRGLIVHPTTGEVIVVNTGAGIVSRYSQTGTLLGTFGGMGTAPGKFVEGGRGITVDGQGDLWIGDMPNFRAQQFTADAAALIGVYPTPAQPPVKGGFTMPGALDLRNDGGIVVNDTFNWRIQTADRDRHLRPPVRHPQHLQLRPRRGGRPARQRDRGRQQRRPEPEEVQRQAASSSGPRSRVSARSRSTSAPTARSTPPTAAPAPSGCSTRPAPRSARSATRRRSRRAASRSTRTAALWLVGTDNGKIVHYAANGTVLGVVRHQGPADDPARRVRRRHRRLHPRVRRGQGQAPDQGLDARTARSSAPTDVMGTGNGQFVNPMGLATLGEGRILVLDAAGERIQEVTFTG